MTERIIWSTHANYMDIILYSRKLCTIAFILWALVRLYPFYLHHPLGCSKYHLKTICNGTKTPQKLTEAKKEHISPFTTFLDFFPSKIPKPCTIIPFFCGSWDQNFNHSSSVTLSDVQNIPLSNLMSNDQWLMTSFLHLIHFEVSSQNGKKWMLWRYRLKNVL